MSGRPPKLKPDAALFERVAAGQSMRSVAPDYDVNGVFRTIDYENMEPAASRMRLDELLRRRAELNARNRPNDRAFKKAQKKIDSDDLSYGAELPAPSQPPKPG